MLSVEIMISTDFMFQTIDKTLKTRRFAEKLLFFSDTFFDKIFFYDFWKDIKFWEKRDIWKLEHIQWCAQPVVKSTSKAEHRYSGRAVVS